MVPSPADTGTLVRLEREIAAPPEEVFEAFTQAEKLSRWFTPSDDYQCVVHALDARPGGRYRVTMRRPDGYESIVTGTYAEVTRPTRLVFSWTWEDKPEHLTSRVTVDLAPRGAGTRLVLVHEQLPSAESREAHAKGWTGCLERLTRAV